MSEDMLTQENRDFIEEVKQDKLSLQQKLESPILKHDQQELVQWDPQTRRVGLIARKIGNYPLWSKDGKKFQTTLLQVLTNTLVILFNKRYSEGIMVLDSKHNNCGFNLYLEEMIVLE